MTDSRIPQWMKITLILAAIYNLVWGAGVLFYPTETISFLGLGDLNHIQIWQCLGMIVGVYGIGYACAANNPIKHWPIILVGFLGKLFGPIGFLHAAYSGDLPWRFGLLNISNDLIWLLPFAIILLKAFKQNTTD